MAIKRVVILNGPPGAGKDLLGEQIRSSGIFPQLHIESFKKPLLAMAAPLIGMSLEDMMNEYELLKNRPVLGDKNLRQVLIDLSERYIKPTYGLTHMGTLAAKRIKGISTHGGPRIHFGKTTNFLTLAGETVLFTDSGFAEEVAPLIPLVESASDIHIVRIHRGGHDYSKCSRTYLTGDMPLLTGCSFYDIYNTGSPKELLMEFVEGIFLPLHRKEKEVA